MIRPVYIHATAALSPQHTFEGTGVFLQPPYNYTDNKVRALDPDYSQYINPVAIRRMSRMIKMGLSTGMRCLRNAGVQTPDAIITGTGRGSKLDMEIFLKDMIRLEEEALNPTHFIQSTYNSVNGWLALQTKCNGYNQTYVHRGWSLELALLDAQMLISEQGPECRVLAGGFDEITDEYYFVKDKIGYWKKERIESLQLLHTSYSPGTIIGEGASYFLLSGAADNAICTLTALQCYSLTDFAKLRPDICSWLHLYGFMPEDIDLLLGGFNGDLRHEPIYDTITSLFPESTAVAGFKHLCGEYDTATGFGLWLACELFRSQTLPDIIALRSLPESRRIRNILLVNHFNASDISLLLLQQTPY